MNQYNYSAKNISKSFDKKKDIFNNINFNLENGQIIGIKGTNGSGKSTLMKILSGLLSFEGQIEILQDQKSINFNDLKNKIYFSAPYTNFYRDLTIDENMIQFSKLIFQDIDFKNYSYLLYVFKLENHKNKTIKLLSSGMNQKVKLLAAFLFDFPLIFLDELSTNLDDESINITNDLIKTKDTSIFFLAGNDSREFINCNQTIELGK